MTKEDLPTKIVKSVIILFLIFFEIIDQDMENISTKKVIKEIFDKSKCSKLQKFPKNCQVQSISAFFF